MKTYLGLFLFLAMMVVSSCEKMEDEGEKIRVCEDPNSLYALTGDTDPEKPCLIPQRERKALVLYFMSNDCPGCGSWGTNLFHSILQDNPTTTEGLQIHIKYSDPWIIKGFSDTLLARYTPHFTPFVLVENRVPSGVIAVQTDLSVLLPKAKIWVDEIVNTPAEIAPALAFRVENEKVKIYYGGQFQDAGEGEYSFGLYLMEDNLEYNQAGSSLRPYIHKNTIREAIGGAWGMQISNGMHSKGELFVRETEIERIGYWKSEDLHLLGVVWKKDDKGKMQVVNTIHVR